MGTNTITLVPLSERPLHERVAAVVRAQMATYQVTQAQLANALNVTQQTISVKRGGRVPFTVDELEVMAPVFGMEPDDILREARNLRPVAVAPVGPRPPMPNAGEGLDRRLQLVVRPTGFEPAAFCSGGRRSIH